MEGMEEQIQRIENKVQQLLKEYSLAQKEIARLQKENTRLSQQLEAQSNQSNKLHQKVDTLKMHAAALDDNAKKDLEKRINIYLKDIEKCLALLHS